MAPVLVNERPVVEVLITCAPPNAALLGSNVPPPKITIELQAGRIV